MGVKINFDITNHPEQLTLILANRSGNKLGQLNAKSIIIGDSLNDADEISFKVYKYIDGEKDYLWDKIKDFKLIYCKESDMWYEISVDINESNETVKTVSCTQLGQAELSQIYLYDFEVNTEDDIARDDYTPTVLFNENNPNGSLLHRIFKDKAIHYTIIHVDDTIANKQRTFSWDGKSIIDAFEEISSELKCFFELNHNFTDNTINRTVAVYDLESNCLDCGYRGDFIDVCPKCNSHNILEGYGEDTNIFITADELGKDIRYSTDVGAVKNCFKLVAGDDLMTATIRNCNPNGSDYIWYISDDLKEDMSTELVDKLEKYDELYSYYSNEYSIEINESILSRYNNLISKYNVINSNLETIKNPIVGYSALMTELYKTIDAILFLQSEMLPSVELSSTNAEEQVKLLTSYNLSPVSVSRTDILSESSANNAILSVAKCVINADYQIKINSSSLSDNVWTGDFKVTNYSNEEDSAISAKVSVIIDDDYENYVYQKIQKILSQDSGESTDVTSLFKNDLDDFKNELKKYNLDSLISFYDICQSCVDILIEQGVADKKSWDGKEPNLYDDLYYPYRRKLEAIQEEQKKREEEIAIISGVYDSEGVLINEGIQTILSDYRNNIQDILNFEKYLGNDLWLEFCSYRREDKYSNSNYISDGLNNTELFQKAVEFRETANKELRKSAELQHSITAKLHNLLAIPKFQKIVENFKVGNWLRLLVDDNVYKLRLLHYKITYDNLNNIDVEFSDVMKAADGISDQQSIIQQASSMASSYDYVQRQANQGAKSKNQLENWINNGLSLTNMKIVGNADNQNITWDSHGLLCREYLPITDIYSNKQLKIINKGLYLTDDNWETSRAGIGNFNFYNPETGKYEEGYGVIADTIIGNLILSEKVGIYNTENSITLDENGLIITTDNTQDDAIKTSFIIQKRETDENNEDYITQLLYVNTNGELVLNGNIKVNTYNEDLSTLNELIDFSSTTEQIMNNVNDLLYEQEMDYKKLMTDLSNGLNFTINETTKIICGYTDEQLNNYKNEVGQYLQFTEEGLILGAKLSEHLESSFRTVIDNQRMAFWDGQTVTAYASNKQFYMPSAVIGTVNQNGDIVNGTLMQGGFISASRNNGAVSISWNKNRNAA